MDEKERIAREKRLGEDIPDPTMKRTLRPAPASLTPQGVKHVWTSEDTYADLAFKHYGSMQEPYWRLIYDHNKQIIGNHPNDIRVGLEIEIPPLPDELKNK